MKLAKFILALAGAALGSAIPVANHTATDIANHTVTNVASHTANNIADHTANNIVKHTATGMAKSALSLPSCTLYETWIHWEYDVWIGDVDDIDGKCKGLWDNLPHVECATHYQAYCGGIQSTRLLQWHFFTTDLCSQSAVQHAVDAAMGGMWLTCDRGN